VKKPNFLAVFLLFLLPGVAAASQLPLVDPAPITVPANLSQADTVKAIKQGLDYRKWIVGLEQPGLVRATVSASGGVQATVDVSYDAQKIQIKYVSSQNLDEKDAADGQRTIASRYINWSRNLVLSITQALLQQPLGGK